MRTIEPLFVTVLPLRMALSKSNVAPRETVVAIPVSVVPPSIVLVPPTMSNMPAVLLELTTAPPAMTEFWRLNVALASSSIVPSLVTARFVNVASGFDDPVWAISSTPPEAPMPMPPPVIVVLFSSVSVVVPSMANVPWPLARIV